MCIYYTKRTDLHYDSAEHIVPAAIGGIATLPKEYVSQEFNTAISGLEQDFIREGMIALARPVIGPGKRGSLSQGKATKSKVQVIRDVKDTSSIALGYFSLKKTYEIPHLVLSTVTGELTFHCSELGMLPGGPEEEVLRFKNQCNQAGELRIKIMEDADLPPEVILVGIADGVEENYNCFFAKNPTSTIVPSTEYLKRIGQAIQFKPDIQFRQYQPLLRGTVTFKLDHLRIYGKIAFNFLALIAGPEVVTDPAFDPVRHWIVNGGHYANVALDPKNVNPLDGMDIPLPDYAHIIYLVRDGRRLLAKLYFYGGLSVTLLLTEDYPVKFQTDGFICDWRNKKEYRLHKYLLEHVRRANASRKLPFN
jgi:hypothetical protein